MKYFLHLFSPETYEAFTRSDKTVTGFKERHQAAAAKVEPGDRLLCYMTKASRWVGVLEVLGHSFRDATAIFTAENDPFVIRFRVSPLVWLPVDKSIPIHDDMVWNRLSFTRGQRKNTSNWTGKLRGSLVQLLEEDASYLDSVLESQMSNGTGYPVGEAEYKRWLGLRVRRADKDVSVSVPDNSSPSEGEQSPSEETRESIRIQALLAEIGSQMGMDIWIPRSDRVAVLSEWRGEHAPILERLPLNYDDTTLKTIEQIDVLWLKGRAIKRAFEVEHTTSVYSGILRMADLLALQPNMDIRLHIVAPSARRKKVFQEVMRPVFSLLERGPLYESCTFLSYDSIQELSKQPHLIHLKSSVFDEYEEEAEV